MKEDGHGKPREEREAQTGRRLGVITLGQAPRDDVVPSMAQVLSPIQVLEAGALDRVDADTISEYAARPGEDAYVTLLRNGESIVVSKERIVSKVKDAARDLSAEVDALMILCSGTFSTAHIGMPIIYPDRLVAAAISAWLEPTEVLGVISPLKSQTEGVARKWRRNASAIAGSTASPYDPDELAAAIEEIIAANPRLILLDCMGFAPHHRASVRAQTDCPVLLPSTYVSSQIREMLS